MPMSRYKNAARTHPSTKIDLESWLVSCFVPWFPAHHCDLQGMTMCYVRSSWKALQVGPLSVTCRIEQGQELDLKSVHVFVFVFLIA